MTDAGGDAGHQDPPTLSAGEQTGAATGEIRVVSPLEARSRSAV